MTVLSSGINGNAIFSLLPQKGNSIYTNMKLEDLAKSIVGKYPELALEIFNYFEGGFASDFPEELNLSRLDPSPKAELIEEISKLFDFLDEEVKRVLREKRKIKAKQKIIV